MDGSQEKTMKIEEAIKLAIEGGYNCYEKNCSRHVNTDGTINRGVQLDHILANLEATFLDPLFWQSLGKAMGWEDGISEKDWNLGKGRMDWKKCWHRFIDKLAEGGTAESFFENL